jgi:hypothetical protein
MAMEKPEPGVKSHKLPLIVTVHKTSNQVVRIKARWDTLDGIKVNKSGEVVKIIPEQCFTHFQFIPDPGGGFYALGFGQLLEPLNESINTVINQLLDAGRCQNQGGGFLGRGIRIKGGQIQVKPGEWTPVDTMGQALKDNIVPYPWPQPSEVLLKLLGVLVEASERVASIKAVVNDEGSPELKTGAVMALMEKGLKVYTGIMKRIFRAFSDEFDKLYVLNSRWLDDMVYFHVTGKPEALQIGRQDYALDKLDVTPVADPEMSTDMQRMIKAQALLQASGRPGIDEVEVTRRWVAAIRPGDESKLLISDKVLSGEEQPIHKMPPNPKMLDAQAKIMLAQAKMQESQVRLQMDMKSFELEMELKLADIQLKRANAIKALADAKDTDQSDSVEMLKAELDRITNEAKMGLEILKMQAGGANAGGGAAKQGGVGGPAQRPAVSGSPQGGAVAAGGLQ